MSSETSQRKIDEALGNLKGVFKIVEIIVVGCGSTDAKAADDNQRNLSDTFERCSERNIILNEEKQQTGLNEIAFHCHRITSEGAKVDETKVEAIHITCLLPLTWSVDQTYLWNGAVHVKIHPRSRGDTGINTNTD